MLPYPQPARFPVLGGRPRMQTCSHGTFATSTDTSQRRCPGRRHRHRSAPTAPAEHPRPYCPRQLSGRARLPRARCPWQAPRSRARRGSSARRDGCLQSCLSCGAPRIRPVERAAQGRPRDPQGSSFWPAQLRSAPPPDSAGSRRSSSDRWPPGHIARPDHSRPSQEPSPPVRGGHRRSRPSPRARRRRFGSCRRRCHRPAWRRQGPARDHPDGRSQRERRRVPQPPTDPGGRPPHPAIAARRPRCRRPEPGPRRLSFPRHGRRGRVRWQGQVREISQTGSKRERCPLPGEGPRGSHSRHRIMGGPLGVGRPRPPSGAAKADRRGLPACTQMARWTSSNLTATPPGRHASTPPRRRILATRP